METIPAREKSYNFGAKDEICKKYNGDSVVFPLISYIFELITVHLFSER
jgi:hypothetical protein